MCPFVENDCIFTADRLSKPTMPADLPPTLIHDRGGGRSVRVFAYPYAAGDNVPKLLYMGNYTYCAFARRKSAENGDRFS